MPATPASASASRSAAAMSGDTTATPRSRPAAARRDQMAVVGAQEAGLHQHAARHAVRVQQGQVLRQRRVVVRRVPARVGQRQSLAKDVRVSVDGGALQAGLQRVALTWGGRLFSVWRNSRKEGYSFLLLENVLFIPNRYGNPASALFPGGDGPRQRQPRRRVAGHRAARAEPGAGPHGKGPGRAPVRALAPGRRAHAGGAGHRRGRARQRGPHRRRRAARPRDRARQRRPIDGGVGDLGAVRHAAARCANCGARRRA